MRADGFHAIFTIYPTCSRGSYGSSIIMELQPGILSLHGGFHFHESAINFISFN